MLTLGWSDGATFLPVAFSLLSSEDPDNRYVEMNPDIDKRTNGYMRRRESIKKATDTLVSLLKQVRAYGIPATYVLCDSWFAYPKVIKGILHCKLHTICMLKDMPTLRYRYNGSLVTLGSLYRHITKKRGRAKILASVVVDIGPDEAGTPIFAKIVFVRDRNRKRQWLALLSTDSTLSDEEIVRLYGRRWDIEVPREGRIRQSVEVRPRLRDSGPCSVGGVVAREQDGEALRQHSLKGGCATLQVVTCSERRGSLVTRNKPVAETFDNVRRQQGQWE
jgi:Transposase DDE domain